MTYEIQVDMKCRDSRLIKDEKKRKEEEDFHKNRKKIREPILDKDSGVFSMKGQIIFI